jgi:hypothetical protein
MTRYVLPTHTVCWIPISVVYRRIASHIDARTTLAYVIGSSLTIVPTKKAPAPAVPLLFGMDGNLGTVRE